MEIQNTMRKLGSSKTPGIYVTLIDLEKREARKGQQKEIIRKII